MQLLVVDDSPTLLRWFVAMVRPLGHALATAPSAEVALELLAKLPVDLVITDLVMPGLSGAELLAEVRKRHPHLPVVIMSGVDSVTGAVELLKSGADEFLPKPLRQDELLSCLERVGVKAQIYSQSRLFDRFVESMLSGLEGASEELPAFHAARDMVLLRFERLYAERLSRLAKDLPALCAVSGLSGENVRELFDRHHLPTTFADPPVPDFLTPP